VFNRKSTGFTQGDFAELQAKVSGMDRELHAIEESMASRHRNLETEWLKVSLMVKSQMGRLARLARNEEGDTPEVLPQAQETASDSPKQWSHDDIRAEARRKGMIR